MGWGGLSPMGRDTVSGFAAALRRLREQKGLTIDTLAEASGIHRDSIAKLEREDRAPSLRIAFQLADALGVKVDDLRERDVAPVGKKPAGAKKGKPKKGA